MINTYMTTKVFKYCKSWNIAKTSNVVFSKPTDLLKEKGYYESIQKQVEEMYHQSNS